MFEENNITADYFIASEAGITDVFGAWIDINAAVVEDKNGIISTGISQGFEIPEKYVDEVKSTELGMLMDRLFSGKELGKGKGGINFLTKDEVTRIDLTRNAFVMALIKFINGEVCK